MNESVLAMIKKLHARLDDLTAVVGEAPFELNGYDKRLDKIDDQIYLIEVELEKKLKNTVPLSPVSDAQSDAFDKATHKDEAQKSAVHIVEENTSAASESKVTIQAEPAPAGGDGATKSSDESAASTSEAAGDPASEAESGSAPAQPKEEGFLTDSAKETIAGATKKLNTIYKEGKEVVGEFSEAFGDIKEVLGKNPFKKR